MAFYLWFPLLIVTSSRSAGIRAQLRPLSSPILGQRRWESDMSLDDDYACSTDTPLTNRRTSPKEPKQLFPNPIRSYKRERNPAFPDRVFIGTKLDTKTLNIGALAYDSVSTGEIAKSDHDLVYQIIQFPINGTFNQQMFTALIITWNFGESNGRDIKWFEILSNILVQIDEKYEMDGKEFNTVFFSFQEGHCFTMHKELISKMKIMFRNLIHVETTQMKRSPYFVVSGMLFMHKKLKTTPLEESASSLALSNSLFFDDYSIGFHAKGAVFTKPMLVGIDENGHDIVIMFIAMHCRVDNSKKDYGFDLRRQDFDSMRDRILSRFADGRILCIGAGDINFRQNGSDLITYAKRYDQFYQFLKEDNDDFWKELMLPTGFRATYKHNALKNTMKLYWALAAVCVFFLYLLRVTGIWQ